jgi:pimeloyl-ACP methyl ester carboxylesterase
MSRIVLAVIIGILSFGTAGGLHAEPPLKNADRQSSQSDALADMATPTLGGKQFWADELIFHDWRIQRHVYTGHCRLLDDKNYRRAWGDFEQCRERLEELKRQHELPPLRGKVVIVLHGLGRSRTSMSLLSHYLAQEGGYEVLNFSYPSTRDDLAGHAASLARVIQNLDDVEEINFVAHSLGSLVVRYYLAEQENALAHHSPAPRIHRIVMLGPPNSGTALAELFRDNKLFGLLAGKSGKQLAADWQNLQSHLATPRCEFGVIAGGRGNQKGNNVLLEGDDDLVVRVAETRLAGARDFAVVPVIHTFLLSSPQVHQYTLRFLQHGYFVSERQRQPIGAVSTARGDRR